MHRRELIGVVRADVPGLEGLVHPAYPPFDLGVPDQHRADIWLEEFHQFERDSRQSESRQCTRNQCESVQHGVEHEERAAVEHSSQEVRPIPCRANDHAERLKLVVCRSASLGVCLA